jgi:hypothetical protein
MRSGSTLAVAVGVFIVLGAVISSGCGGGGGKPTVATTTPGYSSRPVSIEGISPSRAPLGGRVTIRGSGFSLKNNDVGFAHPDVDPQGQDIGYLNGIASVDAKTLTFNLPDNQGVLLAACAFSQSAPGAACPDVGITLPFGDSVVFVANEYGSSNGVTLTVTSP